MLFFFQPVWLLLLIPLAVAWLVWPLPGRGLRLFRAVTLVLVTLALAQFALRLPDRAGTVIVVADRSESMPGQASTTEKEIIDLLHKHMKPRDQLGVVAFGRQAIVEQAPQPGSFAGFTAQVGAGHSDLNGALETALTLIPPDGGGRILVVSDGKWTGKDPAAAAARAAGRSVPVDYRLLTRPTVSDVAIQSFQVPESVQPGQAYILSTWIRSPVDQEVNYQLRRGNTIIGSGTKQVSSGLTRLMFRDRAGATGVYDYTVEVLGPPDDPIVENNQARALVSVEGSKPILAISAAGENSGLTRLLRGGNVEIIGQTPAQSRWSLEELAQYSAVLIENVPAGQIGPAGMETLAAWVESTSSGLLMTGGQKSYGPGGYFKSPLERVMPVSMEMRREHRKMSLAIVVALDRSGSMAMPAGGGRTKMDLADLGTVQVLDLLSPVDEIGVIAVDSSAHEIVSLDTVERNASQRSRILSIDSQGGGIFIYEALSAAAGMIVNARAETRHIILFADAADSEEPGRYIELLQKCQEAGITVSVVGMGTEMDSDAALLKDIAARGGGTCYFSDSPDEIPRLFAQDTFTVARSTFISEPSPFQLTAGYSSLGTAPGEAPPALGGYNLTYLKPEANLAASSLDEYKAPVVASWNAGNGRVLCFAGEADGKFSGDFAGWRQAGEFYSTLARWAAGKRQPLPDDQLLTEPVREGVCFVQLHLDPERKADPFAALPKITVLHGLPGSPPAKEVLPLQWKNADLLEAAIPIGGRETVLNTVEIPGQSPVTLAPVCLPYSPEFAPDQPGRGAATLAQIAATSGGKERIEIPQTWAELPSRPRFVDLSPWLFVAAVILFLTEVFERRTGWLSRLAGRKPQLATVPNEEPVAVPAPKPAVLEWLVRKRARRAQRPAAPATPQARAESRPPAPAPSAPTGAAGSSSDVDSNLESLRKARERANRRTNRDS
jgi:Mg-chelatase subunit ChlD